MPNWKKVITSGSAGELSSLFAPSITGSLLGTASYAITSSLPLLGIVTASSFMEMITFTKGDGSTFQITLSTGSVASSSYSATASYVLPLRQDVIITGSLLLTGSHISTVDYIDFTILPTPPAFNTGRLHWTDDTKTLQLDTDVNNFELEIGHQSVIRGRNVNSFTITKGTVVYINGESGNRPTFATASWEGDPSSATTIGIVAQDINSSQTGYAVTDGLIRGINTTAFTPGTSLYLSSSGQYSSTPAISPLHEVRLGKTITQAVDGIIYVDIMNGYEIGELHDVLITSASTGDLIVFNSASRVWQNTKQLTGSYAITGSLTATTFTGSLLGTASFATSASRAITASFANTASFVTPLIQNVLITGSLQVTQNITGSRMFLSASSNMNSGSTLTVYGSGSTQPVFTVQGSQGELFSVTDSLSGSLFSVNDISGLPILEVFSDNTTLIGNYLDPMLITTAKVTQTTSGSFTVYSLPTASYDTAFFEYSVKSGSNARAGTIMAIQSGSSVNFTETTTTDFGSTSAIALGVFVTGSFMALTGSSSTGSWTIKAIVRGI